MKPTEVTYQELQLAYDHFNKEIFSDSLPPCLLTLQREKNTAGYFSPERFISRGGERTDEVAMNPRYFAVVPVEEIMQTLVHEMVHLWQHHFGQPGRRGYHNRQWAAKMDAVGLVPSITGRPGGKRTGDKMSDYIATGGQFERECKRLLTTKFKISWMDRFPGVPSLGAPGGISAPGGIAVPGPPPFDPELLALVENADIELGTATPNKSNRVKYSCPDCRVNVWGKPELKIVCGECGQEFLPA